MPTSDLKIAAAYIRVSTDDQEEYSPDSQVRLIREYARKNGYLLPEEYVFQDDGISAATARKRPAFNRMIALAKEKERPFDAILVLMFSRFARNREESVLYKGLLRKQGISVISVKEPAVDGPFGTLIESIIEWFDEYYLKGFDDWQLALRRENQRRKELERKTFKEQYLNGWCELAHIEDCTEQWQHRAESNIGLTEYLGLTREEHETFLRHGREALGVLLEPQRRSQRFVLYQLELDEQKAIPFAFKDMEAVKKAGYQPVRRGQARHERKVSPG